MQAGVAGAGQEDEDMFTGTPVRPPMAVNRYAGNKEVAACRQYKAARKRRQVRCEERVQTVCGRQAVGGKRGGSGVLEQVAVCARLQAVVRGARRVRHAARARRHSEVGMRVSPAARNAQFGRHVRPPRRWRQPFLPSFHGEECKRRHRMGHAAMFMAYLIYGMKAMIA